MKKLYTWFLEKYQSQSLEYQKKSKILLTTNLIIALFGLILAIVMFLTEAYIVGFILLVLFTFCGITMLLIRAGNYKAASYFFLIYLFLVMFSAIKFDEYVSIYETYVFGTLGLFLLSGSCLIGFSRLQPVIVTVLNVAAIILLYVLDTYPQDGHTLTLLHIQSLATSLILVIIGGIFGVSVIGLQKTLLSKVEQEIKESKRSFFRLDKMIKSAQDSGMEIGNRLALSSKDSMEMMSEINHYLAEIQSEISNLNNTVINSTRTNQQMVQAAQNALTNMGEYRKSVEKVSSAIQQIIMSIKQISQNATNKENIINELVETANKGQVEMSHSKNSIEKISQSASNIMEMINMIIEITERTNLLALNAAIEASHAGEAGKGFAVVAGEIRKLSRETKTNSSEITDNLRQNTTDINNAAEVGVIVENVFREISNGIRDVSVFLEELVHGINEISEGTDEILNAVSDIEQVSVNFSGVMNDASDKVSLNSQSIQAIDELAKKVMERIMTISSIFDKMHSEAEHVDSIGKENLEHIQKISEEIDDIDDQSVRNEPA